MSKSGGLPCGGGAQAGAPDGGSLGARDSDGHVWHFGLAALTGNNIFVAYGMRESRSSPDLSACRIDFLLPIFMIYSPGAIWVATDRQVTHWITYLAASRRPIAAALRHPADLVGARPNSSCWAMR